MEYLAALGVVGLGYVLQSNMKKPINKKFIRKIANSEKPSFQSPYTSKRAYNIWEDEQKKADVLFAKSKFPQDTNIVTPGPTLPIVYNKVDFAEKNLPIEFNSYQQYDNILIEDNKPNKIVDNDSVKNNKSLPDTGGWQGISLTGDPINPNTFTHNNQTPFFGSAVRQNLDEFSTRGIFENFTGTQDNYQKKQEQGLLFEPQKNMTNIYGQGSLDGFMLDRYYVSNIRSNETPIEKVYVGPGLNQGYTAEPTGGFQQADSQDYVMPKTTDEIRVKTNPKISYYGRVVSGEKINKPTKMGTLYKNRPDTFYIQEPDRYFTTTGQVIAAEQRPCIVTKYTNRKTTELKTRTGSAAPTHGTVAQVRSKYKVSQKVTYTTDGARNANNENQWSILGMLGLSPNNDYGKKSIKIRANKRDVNNNDPNITRNIKPINSSGVLRPTQKVKNPKKNQTIDNKRIAGNFQGRKKPITYDPNDVPKTTIKESSIYNDYSGNVQDMNRGNTVYNPNSVARTTIKETNIDNNYGSNVSNTTRGNTVYDPNSVARTTIKETNIDNNYGSNVSNTNRGNTVYDPNDIARTTIKETNIENNYGSNVSNTTRGNTVYDPNAIARTTIKETNIDNDYSGNVSNPNRGNTVYDPEAVARTTIKETNIYNNHSGMIASNKPSRGVVYDPSSIPKTTIKETTGINKRKANMSSGKVKNYAKNADLAKVTTKETTMLKNAVGIATKNKGEGYAVQDIQVPYTNRPDTSVYYVGDAEGPELGAYEVTEVHAPNTTRQFTSDIEYFGGAGNDGVNTKPMSYQDIYNAEIKAIRSVTDGGYTPGAMGPNKGVNSSDIHVTTSKMGDIQNQYITERGVQSNKVYNSIPQITSFNLTQEKEIVPNEPLADRINPDIVKAFKENPYTQSLTSWA